MLLLALFLVVAAFGLLIASLALSMMLLAWGSAAVSVLAALLLIFDSWRRRRARRRSRRLVAAPAPKIKRDLFDESGTVEPDNRHKQDDTSDEAVDDAEGLVAPDEPAVEQTSEDDLRIVAELTDEVVVVDERPRYHLTSCDWLVERPTLPLPVHEARELGFTPCAQCSPDAELLGRRRAQQTDGAG